MILVIDNYDSFTYNLVQYLAQCGAETTVLRNDKVSMEEIVEIAPAGIMLSPGPGDPGSAGVCRDVCAAIGRPGPLDGIPVFGVCLGMQTMGEVGGGTVRRAKSIMHGKISEVEHDGMGLFAGVENPVKVVRYHSLVVDEASLPSEYIATARSLDDGELMGIRHKTRLVEGVQFHPESIKSEFGMKIIENFVFQTAR